MTNLQLFYDPPGVLRLTVDDEKSYPKVSLYQSSPLRRPGKFLSLLDGKSEEIALVPSLEDLEPESRKIAELELARRYLTARIQTLTSVRQEFGVTYWHALTDRGERDFVVQNLSESCLWLSESHLLIIDADNNRFEVADTHALDPNSRRLLESVL
ncbi:DUF1854 domain-containing protein [Armatimonas sp.]|uniref:DUF1854 domain-containing protein n=1 Tax=Armatimonas sp. TaxID=1872638 RepID=UPI00286AE2DD|nr:DUF1854 domain-containing protein [Armatimonas sp.]